MTRAHAQRLVATALLAAAGLTAGALSLHARLARSAAGSCPVASTVDPSALEAERRAAMRPLAGERRAPALHVAPYVLGETRREQLVHLREESGGRCDVELGGAAVRCPPSPGAPEELLARFDPAGRLVALDGVRYGLDGEEAEALLSVLAGEARAHYGAPTRAWGEGTATFLARPLRQAGFSYRFADLAVDVTATRFDDGAASGVVLRTQHRAVADRADHADRAGGTDRAGHGT